MAYILTGSVAIGGLVALVEPLCNTVAYYLHEQAWLRFGRQRPAMNPPNAFGHHHLSGTA